MDLEKRIYKRYPVSGRILIQTQSMEAPGELVDIGQWGAHIRTEIKPDQGEELTARMEVHDYPGVLEVRGMVVRV
ncbi:MAG: PilZ domain-containing protein, partial [Acidobacteria bacterium]|nr:PilZ domain-containing protein [Acidobacteriota bacterium]